MAILELRGRGRGRGVGGRVKLFVKVWWTVPLFFTLLAFLSYIQYTYTFLHPYSFIPCMISSVADTESGFELGPALQGAGVLPTEPCRTLVHEVEK
jgi:hypothetical protein